MDGISERQRVAGTIEKSSSHLHKLRNEFDSLRAMGFASDKIIAALDSCDGDISTAVAILLSNVRQLDETDESFPPIPTRAPNPTHAPAPTPASAPSPARVNARVSPRAPAPAAAPMPTPAPAPITSTAEARVAAAAPKAAPMSAADRPVRTPDNEIIAMFLDHPRGMKGSTIKYEFLHKYDRPLIIPAGNSQTQFLNSIPGISVEFDVDSLPYFRYEGDSTKRGNSNQKTSGGASTVAAMAAAKVSSEYPRRKDDWDCTACGNVNYGWRDVCQFGCNQESEVAGAGAKLSKEGKEKKSSEAAGPKSISMKDLDLLIDPPSVVKIMSMYKTKECKNDKKHEQNNCQFWHNDGDRRRNPYGPIRYTHLMCEGKNTGGKSGGCRLGDACLFAHNMFEQMFHPFKFKTVPCCKVSKGCHHTICGYSHNKEEARRLQLRNPAEGMKSTTPGAVSAVAQVAPTGASAGKGHPKGEEQMPDLKPAAGPTTLAHPVSTTNTQVKASGKVSRKMSGDADSASGGADGGGWSIANATGGSVPDGTDPFTSGGDVGGTEKENVPATATLQQQVKQWKQRKEFQDYLSVSNGHGQAAVSTGTGADAPLEYCCYLSKRIMVDPVIAADGETYERGVIEAWFNIQARHKSPFTSPTTQELLDDNVLTPNTAIRILIESWRANLNANVSA